MNNKIAEIIAGIAGVSVEAVLDSKDIVAELGVNSLKQMELVDELEEAFDVSISVKAFRDIPKNVSSIGVFVENLGGKC